MNRVRSTNRARRRTGARSTLAAGILLIAPFIAGCSRAELGQDAYFLAVSLDQVFERQDATQLARAEDLISEHQAEGKINASEAKALTELVVTAEQGGWEQAREETRELLSAQSNW